MTNRQRFFLNGFFLTLVGLAVRSVSLGFASYISYAIGAEGMGLFTLISTVYSFAITFASAGISLTVTRLVSAAIGEGNGREVRGVLKSAILYALFFSLLAAFVLFFFASFFAENVLLDERGAIPLRILSFSLVPVSLCAVFSGYFIGVKRVAKNAIVQILAQVFKIVITVFLVVRFARLGTEEGIIALALSITLTELAVFAVALIEYIIDKRKYFPTSTDKTSHLPSVIGTALPLGFSAWIRSALLSLEHILIPKRLRDRGEEHNQAIASYGVLHGMALPMLLYPMAPLSSFAGLLVPEFSESMARGEGRRLSRIAGEALGATLIYAIASGVFLYTFSEELGYVVYDSYDAGFYISMMAVVIPIMYLDHVADAMLKGIGEQVYSMWVNISDAILSILLVWFLIPVFGIAGYAIVIIVMEGYNFVLSIIRLYSKIRFKIDFLECLVFPFVSALACGLLSRKIFAPVGSTTTPLWLILEIIFAVCVFIFVQLLLTLLFKRQKNKTHGY